MFAFIILLMVGAVSTIFLLIAGGFLYSSTKQVVRNVGSVIAGSGAVIGFAVAASVITIFASSF